MFNPLRIPMVLIVIFSLMLFYVHAHHRHQVEPAQANGASHGPLQLRQPDGQERASSFPGHIATQVGGDTQDRQLDPGRRHDSRKSRPSLPLPSVDRRHSTTEEPSVSLGSPEGRLPERERPSPSQSISVTLADSLANRSSLSRDAAAADRLPQTSSVLKRPSPLSSEPQHAGIMHRVIDGDTLHRLAGTYLGDESRYMEILDANRDVLVRPDLLPLGVRLRIPSR